MGNSYIPDQNFKGIDFSEKGIEKAEYENCEFDNCIFANSNLSEFSFEDCTFTNCDFSNTKITGTAFKNVEFENCKLIGLQFDECNPFLLEFRFSNCILNYSSFYTLKLKGTKFSSCILHEVDFTDTQLPGANFTDCDFSAAVFNGTNLQKADFRTSINFSINPEQNLIAGAKFSMETLPGLLHKYKIKIA